MKPEKDTKCGVCATPYFERNNFFYGKQITVRDSFQEQFFFNEKRRLINRMVLGWGVVCGLDVSWDSETRDFVVFQGLAIDCCGREILVCEQSRIQFEAYEEHCKCASEKRDPPKGRYILCLDYIECKTEPVELPPVSCDTKERQENNRIRESFRLRIKPWEDGKRPEEVCLKESYGQVACIDRFKTSIEKLDANQPRPCITPTIHDYLCSESKRGCPECECCDCVVLAVIAVGKESEEHEYGQEQEQHEHPAQQQTASPRSDDQPAVRYDTCTYRRLVYGNPLLYDLIYCHHGDLPHIVDFSWRKLTYPKREVDWETFLQMIKDGLTMTFDQEMISSSLNPHTFLVTFLDIDEGTGTLLPRRIPAERIESKPGRCFTARWIADAEWVRDELERKNSQLADGVDIEIIVRGSRVWSASGKALDADFVADKLPTGNGVQGGDFVDWFTVRPRDGSKAQPKAYESF